MSCSHATITLFCNPINQSAYPDQMGVPSQVFSCCESCNGVYSSFSRRKREDDEIPVDKPRKEVCLERAPTPLANYDWTLLDRLFRSSLTTYHFATLINSCESTARFALKNERSLRASIEKKNFSVEVIALELLTIYPQEVIKFMQTLSEDDKKINLAIALDTSKEEIFQRLPEKIQEIAQQNIKEAVQKITETELLQFLDGRLNIREDVKFRHPLKGEISEGCISKLSMRLRVNYGGSIRKLIRTDANSLQFIQNQEQKGSLLAAYILHNF